MEKERIMSILEAAFEKGREVIPEGNVATYIPELGKSDKNALGLSICTKYGEHFNIGDTSTRFTIQSISKIISLLYAVLLLRFPQ